MNKYFLKYDSTSALHKELTNILLLATEESNFFYCYCDKFTDKKTKCDLCALCHFLFHNNNLMDGLPPEKFLQLNYENRAKLDEFAIKISPFFERIERNHKESLEFFNKEYVWTLKDYSSATYHSLTLTEIIEDDKKFVKNNPQLFDADFLKKTKV